MRIPDILARISPRGLNTATGTVLRLVLGYGLDAAAMTADRKLDALVRQPGKERHRWSMAAPVRYGAGIRSGLLHVAASLEPALEAAEIAHIGITHILEGLADER